MDITIVNLTPHPMNIFPLDTPDRIVVGSVTPIRVIPPSTEHPPVRLGHVERGPADIPLGIPVENVTYGDGAGQGPTIPDPQPGVVFLVSLVVGLAARRPDVLVPHATVRDLEGNIIGTRSFARPI